MDLGAGACPDHKKKLRPALVYECRHSALFRNAMADALMLQEQCDITGFVLTKQVVAGNYVALLPADWADAQADDGSSFEIILLEKGYFRVRCVHAPRMHPCLPTLLSCIRSFAA